MPIYEYRCDRCGVFEITQRITEPALAECPTCSGGVARLISTTSFQLKGSGWYVTDYARKGANGAARDSAEPAAAQGGDSASGGGPAASGATATGAATGAASAGKSPDSSSGAKAPAKPTASPDA